MKDTFKLNIEIWSYRYHFFCNSNKRNANDNSNNWKDGITSLAFSTDDNNVSFVGRDLNAITRQLFIFFEIK